MAHHPSFGAALAWDVVGGAAYAAIGQVKDISGPSISRGTVDVTDHDSTDGWREFIGGLVDGGEVSFIVAHDRGNAQHTALWTSLSSDTCTVPAWQLTLNVCSGSAVWTFDGFLTGLSPSTPVEGENTWEIAVKVTGKATLAVT